MVDNSAGVDAFDAPGLVTPAFTPPHGAGTEGITRRLFPASVKSVSHAAASVRARTRHLVFSQRWGSTRLPVLEHHGIRWKYPVVPTWPMTSPRSTCWPVYVE